MRLGLGLGLSYPRNGGGASAYHADAVHFDGATYLSNASLTTVDSALFSFSIWIKNAVAAGKPLWASDPSGLFANFATLSANGMQQISLANADGSQFLDFGTLQVVPDAWTNYLGTADLNHAEGLKIKKVYLNDVDATQTAFDIGGAFTAALSGFEFIFGSDGSAKIACDIADVWIANGQSLLTSGDIAEATRRKFISAGGKPVNLGADGSTPTGTAPTIFFSGDATAFATNLGTGGAFTLTGSLTDASTSPSD